ncbi:hypothetical protein MNB_SM-3-224 [hydrothermal vent metagenome]|uniref:Uncharacterized protein n=1 Tax=hydrothermal vent metagenome TaxID=652676 RepID=A0A1W1D3C4_9ZZZZ
MSLVVKKLKDLTATISEYEMIKKSDINELEKLLIEMKICHQRGNYSQAREENLARLKELFDDLQIFEKVEKFEDLFEFKAINLSGISLSKEYLGEIKKGKYLQILAIAYDKNAVIKSKNISLAYYGRVENVGIELRTKVVEFVIRYRFEKSFMTVDHYYSILDEL